MAQPPHQREERNRPAFYHAWDRPSSFAGATANRPVAVLTDAGGLTLHHATLSADEVPAFIKMLVETFL